MAIAKVDYITECNQKNLMSREEFVAEFCKVCSTPECVRSSFKDSATQRKIAEHQAMMGFKLTKDKVAPEYQNDFEKLDIWTDNPYRQIGETPVRFVQQAPNHGIVELKPAHPDEGQNMESGEYNEEDHPEVDAPQQLINETHSVEDASELQKVAERAALLRKAQGAQAPKPTPPQAPQTAQPPTQRPPDPLAPRPQVTGDALYREYDAAEEDPWNPKYTGGRVIEAKPGETIRVRDGKA